MFLRLNYILRSLYIVCIFYKSVVLEVLAANISNLVSIKSVVIRTCYISNRSHLNFMFISCLNSEKIV